MQSNCKNIYQATRKIAGLTQERAAELLGLSVRSLADYYVFIAAQVVGELINEGSPPPQRPSGTIPSTRVRER